MTSTAPANYQTIMSRSQEHYDVLVVGKAGNGKSAVCNTLLGQEKFELGRSMSTTTKTADCGDRSYHNATIRVIDTPDITNCDMNESKRRAELQKWQRLMASVKPSLVLLTVRCDVRYTSEEYAIYREIMRVWGPRADKALDKKLVVAFTFGDRQDCDIEQDLKKPPPELGIVLRRAEKRYLVFTNKDGANRPAQAEQCFRMMKTINRKRKTLLERLFPCFFP